MNLFGYGKTTQALADRFKNAKFYDDKVTKPHTNALGHKLYPTSMFESSHSQLEIPSPGIPPFHPLITQAKNLTSEYDFFASSMPYSVWITGTNGKTTTTQMIGHLLADKGCQTGGNIGTPLAHMDPHAPIWALETSSYTLHYTHKATPGLFILLPITPDHLAWHGSFEAYEASKLKPLSTMREGEVAIVPAKYAHIPTKASLVAYETAQDLGEYFGIDITKIAFQGVFLIDALLAMAVDKILFDRIDYEKINAFILDPHRQEKITDTQGRLWINDSKATNIDATIELLKTYSDDHSIHIILGGDDKGIDPTPLFEHLKRYEKLELYLIGTNMKKLTDFAKKYDIPYLECETLDRAIAKINQFHTTTSVAMLSPAAASLDQFTSYANRGETFKEGIAKLS